MKFNSPRQLNTYFQGVLSDIIQNEVKDAIVEIWLRVQQEKVYDFHEPERYERRHSSGGLADPSNIYFTDIAAVGDATVFVLENMTEGATTDVGSVINDIIEGKGISGYGQAVPPRPYTEEAVAIINSHPNSVREAFIRGFAKRGIDINIT